MYYVKNVIYYLISFGIYFYIPFILLSNNCLILVPGCFGKKFPSELNFLFVYPILSSDSFLYYLQYSIFEKHLMLNIPVNSQIFKGIWRIVALAI